MEVNDQTLTELLRLTQDNNKMLHKMRRGALWGGIIKFILYVVIFVVAPLWVYATYLAPIVQQMTATMQQIQGTGAKASAQLSDFQKMWNDIQSKIPGLGNAKQ